jgi:hypothetical protein
MNQLKREVIVPSVDSFPGVTACRLMLQLTAVIVAGAATFYGLVLYMNCRMMESEPIACAISAPLDCVLTLTVEDDLLHDDLTVLSDAGAPPAMPETVLEEMPPITVIITPTVVEEPNCGDIVQMYRRLSDDDRKERPGLREQVRDCLALH